MFELLNKTLSLLAERLRHRKIHELKDQEISRDNCLQTNWL